MGFSKTLNRMTGRYVYSCEASATGCTDYPCAAHHCPFGWCQRYYVCQVCWAQKEVRAHFTKQAHEKCRLRKIAWDEIDKERKELLLNGEFVRTAALLKDGKGVHVIFVGKDAKKIGRYMPQDLYRSFDLLANVTLKDFTERAGFELEEAPENIYA